MQGSPRSSPRYKSNLERSMKFSLWLKASALGLPSAGLFLPTHLPCLTCLALGLCPQGLLLIILSSQVWKSLGLHELSMDDPGHGNTETSPLLTPYLYPTCQDSSSEGLKHNWTLYTKNSVGTSPTGVVPILPWSGLCNLKLEAQGFINLRGQECKEGLGWQSYKEQAVWGKPKIGAVVRWRKNLLRKQVGLCLLILKWLLKVGLTHRQTWWETRGIECWGSMFFQNLGLYLHV